MKKLLALLVLSVALVSCYEEYIVDYPYNAVYFYLQQDVRTFVVGEGMKFKVGVTMGGVSDNRMDRNVSFILDPNLITAARLASMQSASQGYIKDATATVAALELMPTSHYTLSNNTTMVIPTGWYTGEVTVKADSAAYTADSLKTTRIATYVLPFYITDAQADSILETKRSNVIGTMLENMLFGKYWHGGAALIDRSSDGLGDTTIYYFTKIPTVNENYIWTLVTTGPTTLSCNNYFNQQAVSPAAMNLTLKGSTIYISDGAHAAQVIEPDGQSVFNRSKLLQDRRLYLNYKFTDAGSGYVYHCTDTLRFRNRIRDGINEWQDENPSHYLK